MHRTKHRYHRRKKHHRHYSSRHGRRSTSSRKIHRFRRESRRKKRMTGGAKTTESDDLAMLALELYQLRVFQEYHRFQLSMLHDVHKIHVPDISVRHELTKMESVASIPKTPRPQAKINRVFQKILQIVFSFFDLYMNAGNADRKIS